MSRKPTDLKPLNSSEVATVLHDLVTIQGLIQSVQKAVTDKETDPVLLDRVLTGALARLRGSIDFLGGESRSE